MSRSWWAKLSLLIVVVIFAILYVVPTVTGMDTETTKWPFKQKVNLGLDLQGGLYMVLGVDFNKVFKDVVDRQGQNFVGRSKDKGIPVTGFKTVTEGLPADDPQTQISFDPAKREDVYALIKKEYWNLRIAEEKPGMLQLGLSNEYRGEIRERTLSQSIEVIRNRIDEFGVAEPAISSQGNDRVVVELPGVKEIDRAKDLIGRTAKLEFKIVADKLMEPSAVSGLVQQLEKDGNAAYKPNTKFSDYVTKINELAKGKIPEGTQIAFERMRGPGENAEATEHRVPYLLFAKADVTGEDLQDAQVSFDPETRRPEVSFEMNPRGATSMGNLTEHNTGHRMAIVLDNIVHSAPVINSKISDRGRITLGQNTGDAAMKEAKDLAIVLRAGALPAQLDFLEQRVVGPSLGQDSIRRGALSGLVGCALVFIFMIFYYRMSGVVAAISLAMNGLFVMAILVGMEATLTLPGIAGIALTIGMAVDSNVIIFERIRDELREGKSVAAAIEAGFQKAFSAIFDANITHGIIAVILMTYGTGAIRGFAVSLLVGIVTTLFCALTVCKLFFDGYVGLSKGEVKTLSI